MAVYYVKTDGSDNYSGLSDSSAWATWDKCNDVSLNPGDTVYIRGGTYTQASNTQYQCRWYNIRGTSGNMVNIWAYPGETPIWDFSAMPALSGEGMQNFLIQMNQCDYVHIKGLTVCNALQQNAGTFILAWNAVNSQHNIFENCVAHHIGGNGFTLSYTAYAQADAIVRNSEYNTYLNCDAYYCEDPYTNYENANGWNLAWDNNNANIWIAHTTMSGCRAFHNSDDGWDMFGNDSSSIIWENCWSFYNGFDASFNVTGNGQGFKLGRSISDMSLSHMYTLNNCLAVHNADKGFDQNVDPGSDQKTGIIHFYNNLAYDQYGGFYFYQPGENIVNILKNNISYGNSINIMNYDNRLAIWLAIQNEDHNTWDVSLGVTVNASDFISLDHTQLLRSRKINGDLPDVSFGHLATGSDLIGVGIYVADACIYDGEGNLWSNPPSIGAYEYSYDVSDASTGVPTVTTSAVTDISIHNASVLGNVTHDGSIALTYRGVCISTNASPTTLDTSVRDISTGEGAYTLNFTSLNSNTLYHIRAFAYNSQGTAYGVDVSFNTLSTDASTSIPIVTTTNISNISYYTATGGGNVTHDGSLVATKRGICWSTAINPVVTDASSTDGSTGEGSYVSYLTNLSASTHYHVRAFAYNSEGTAYGTDVSFNTLSAPVSVSSSGKNILVGGKFIVIGGRAVKY